MSDLFFPEIQPDMIDTAPAAAPVAAVAVIEPKALDLAQVDLKDVALAKFKPQRTALETAKKTLTGLVLDLPTQAKIDDAVSLRQRLIKQPIADARATSKALKSKLSQTAKDVTAEEEAIVKSLDETAASTITPLIDAAQATIDAEKEAKRQAETARVAAHEANLQIISGYAAEADGKPSGAIRRAIDALLELPLAEAAWEEFHGRAVDARDATVQKLWTLHDQAKQREDEAARAAAEAERLEAQRVENERVAAELAAQRAEIERQAAQLRQQQAEADARRLAEEKAKAKALQQADLNQSFEAAVIRCGTGQVYLVRDSFLALDPAGRVVPDADVEAYIAALNALKPEIIAAGAPADSPLPENEQAAPMGTAVTPGAGDAEAAPITHENTRESGSCPADAPAYASSEAEAAEASPSGDEGTARADHSAPASDCSDCNCLAQCGDVAAYEAEGINGLTEAENAASASCTGLSEHEFLVELPDGTQMRKPRIQLQPEDLLVFDGPDAFASTDRMQAELEAEIAAAGGIDAWRARALASDCLGDPVPAAVDVHPVEDAKEAERIEVLFVDGGHCAPQIVAPVPAAQSDAPPTLTLRAIADRLGFALPEAFLESIGFPAAGRDRAARLYRDTDWPAMKAALIKRITAA